MEAFINVQCREATSRKVGTFLAAAQGTRIAISPGFAGLVGLYPWMQANGWVWAEYVNGKHVPWRVFKADEPVSQEQLAELVIVQGLTPLEMLRRATLSVAASNELFPNRADVSVVAYRLGWTVQRVVALWRNNEKALGGTYRKSRCIRGSRREFNVDARKTRWIEASFVFETTVEGTKDV